MTKITHRHILLIILSLSIFLFFIPFIVFKNPDGSTTPISTIVPTSMSPNFFKYIFGLNCILIPIIISQLIIRDNKKIQFGLIAISIVLSILNYVIFFSFSPPDIEKTNNVGFGLGFYIPIVETLLLGLVFFKIKSIK